MIRAASGLVPFLLAIALPLPAAEALEAANGVFGPGSTIGSDRWFAGITRSILAGEAARAVPDDFGGPLLPDGSRKAPPLPGVSPAAGQRAVAAGAAPRSPVSQALERGHRFVLARDLEGAVREFRAAVELAGGGPRESEPDPRLFLGASLLARGEVSPAIPELRAAVRAEPSGSRARLLHGLALLWSGDPAAARRELEVCRGGETDGLSDLLLGIALDARGETGAAVEAYRRYLARNDQVEVRKRCEDLLRSGKAGPEERREEPAPRDLPAARDAKLLAGSWRVLSSRLFYDEGGGGAQRKAEGTLELGADGVWRFTGKTGRWSVGPIGAGDWDRWKISEYGPRRKVTLEGFGGGAAGGPIEESNGEVEFLWVISRHEPPAGRAGDTHMKFGR